MVRVSGVSHRRQEDWSRMFLSCLLDGARQSFVAIKMLHLPARESDIIVNSCGGN